MGFDRFVQRHCQVKEFVHYASEFRQRVWEMVIIVSCVCMCFGGREFPEGPHPFMAEWVWASGVQAIANTYVGRWR